MQFPPNGLKVQVGNPVSNMSATSRISNLFLPNQFPMPEELTDTGMSALISLQFSTLKNMFCRVSSALKQCGYILMAVIHIILNTLSNITPTHTITLTTTSQILPLFINNNDILT